MKVLIQRIASGFSNRESTLKGHKKKHYKSSRTLHANSDQNNAISLRDFSPIFLDRTIPLGSYIKQIDPFLPEQFRFVLLCYFFSGRYVRDSIFDKEQHNTTLDDEELSIIYQTLYLNDAILDPELLEPIEANDRHFHKLIQAAEPICSFAQLAQHIRHFGHVTKVPPLGLADFNDYMWVTKESLVHTIGPDLFVIFHKILDPDAVYDEHTLRADFDYTSRLNCQDLFIQLALIRSSRGLRQDHKAAEALIEDSVAGRLSIQNSTRQICVAWRDFAESPEHARQQPSNALCFLIDFRAAITREDANGAIENLLKTYNADPEMMRWVNWAAFYALICDAPRQEGLKMAIVYLIMSQPHIGSKFPFIYMRVGGGAFESCLRGVVRLQKDQSLAGFVTKLSAIEGKARDALIDAMLLFPTSTMLSRALAYDPPWIKRLSQLQSLTYDARASAFRSDLATALEKAGMLSSSQAKAVISREQSRLRVAYLQGRQLQGLVKIEWKMIAGEINAIIDSHIALVKRVLRDTEIRNRELYVEAVCDTLAEIVQRIVLIDGPEEIRTIVSDSLRHGQLPNRFLVAFDQAMVQSVGGHVDVTKTLERLERGSTKGVNWLIHLRNRLLGEIKSFNERSLNVGIGSHYSERIREISRNHVASALPNSKSVDVVALVEEFRNELEKLFSEARKDLTSSLARYRSEILALDKAPRRSDIDLSPIERSQISLSKFRLNLLEKLAEAEKETQQWIALAVSQEDPSTFQFDDVVQLCLLNHRTQTGRRLQVVVKVSSLDPEHGRVVYPSPPMIAGRFFHMIETIVKNLLSNAFEKSGQGRNTRIAIEFADGRNRFVISCANTLSPAKYRDTSERIKHLQTEFRTTKLIKAGEDEGSGIHKIRRACNKVLRQMPKVNVKLVGQMFSIEIDGRHTFGSFFEQQKHSSD